MNTIHMHIHTIISGRIEKRAGIGLSSGRGPRERGTSFL